MAVTARRGKKTYRLVKFCVTERLEKSYLYNISYKVEGEDQIFDKSFELDLAPNGIMQNFMLTILLKALEDNKT